MSLPIARRLVGSSRNYVTTPLTSTNAPLPFLIPCVQRRRFFWNRKPSQPAKKIDPLTEEYLRRKPSLNPDSPVQGSLASTSIFGDEEHAQSKSEQADKKRGAVQRNPHTMSVALDPDPSSRQRWERKMVIRQIRKRGRLTRTQIIKKQEREILSKSHDFKTSVKKLMPLARQIAGKTVEEAIVQMRFSKKKAAKEVKAHLEHARNEAIVSRGMGLGKASGNKYALAMIKTKEGKKLKVEDPTTLYVDQAWVGKGLYGQTPDFRARGRLFMMKNPTTHISVLLKEEATRIREHEEREAKLANRKVWTQLPNRPISAQRQYYTW